MRTEEDAALKAVSRAAFGQAHRLAVMLAIADSTDGLVTQTDLARQLGLSVSNVQVPVRSLVECGLLSELPRRDSRSKFFQRNPSAAWNWAKELQKQAASTPNHQDVPVPGLRA